MISPKYIVASVALILSLCAASAQARFLQTDPVGYASDPNLYTYVGNDPSDRTDPSGLCDDVNGCDPQSQAVLSSPEGQKGQGIGAAAGVITGATVTATILTRGAVLPAEGRIGTKVILKMKEGWSSEQKAQALQKARALDNAAGKGELSVTKNPDRSPTSASSRYQQAGGKVEAGKDVDHTHDLQLGGKDSPNNMAPLDSSVNRSLGAQVQQQTRTLPQGTKICGVEIKCP